MNDDYDDDIPVNADLEISARLVEIMDAQRAIKYAAIALIIIAGLAHYFGRQFLGDTGFYILVATSVIIGVINDNSCRRRIQRAKDQIVILRMLKEADRDNAKRTARILRAIDAISHDRPSNPVL